MAKFQGYVYKHIYALVQLEADTAEEAKQAMMDGVWDNMTLDPCMDDYEWTFDESFNVMEADEDDK